MKFSIYSEIQCWPGKPPSAALRRGPGADRERRPARLRRVLGDRALLLPEVLLLARPARALRGRRAADEADQLPDAASTCSRTTTRSCWPRGSPSRTSCSTAATSSASGAATAGSRRRPGVAIGEIARALRGVARDPLHGARERSAFSYDGKFYQVARRANRAAPGRSGSSASSSAARATRHTTLAGASGLGRRRPAAPALRGAAGAARPLPRHLRRARQRAGHRLDPRRATSTRTARWRCARRSRGSRASSPATPRRSTEYEPPAGRRAERRRATASTPPGILEKLAETPYDEMIAGDIVWVGTPEDVIERIEAVQEVCEGLTEISITVNRAASTTGRRSRTRSSSPTGDAALQAARAGGGGLGLVSIERVCVVGAGVIGSLFAAHLSRVAEVWVLTRRPEHARALERGRAERDGPRRVHRQGPCAPTTRPSCPSSTSRSWRRRRPGSTLRRRARRPLPGGDRGDVQNGLGAEQVVRRHGDWPLVSGVTFMSGTRHDDTHVEYILDTETWLGPYNGIPYEPRRGARRPDRALGPEGARLPRPPAGPVVEADLQRDRERGRGADRAAARPAFRGGGAAVRPRPSRPRARRRGQGGRRGGRHRAARGPVGDERARDEAGQRALPVDARGRRGATADRDRPDHRRARPRGRAARRARAAAHGAVPTDQGEGRAWVDRESKGRQE